MMSVTMSWNLLCSNEWLHISVMSLTFSQPGYGSKGMTRIVRGGALPLNTCVLMAAATRCICPLTAGAQVRRGAADHGDRTCSMSSVVPHSFEWMAQVEATSTRWGGQAQVTVKDVAKIQSDVRGCRALRRGLSNQVSQELLGRYPAITGIHLERKSLQQRLYWGFFCCFH